MRSLTKAVTVVLFLLPQIPAEAQQEASPLEVLSYAGEPLGERLVYRVKEEIREARGMQLTDYSEPRMQLMINTAPIMDELRGSAAVYSVLWLFADSGEAQVYLFDSLGVVTSDNLDSTSEGIVAKTDELISTLKKAVLSDDEWREFERSLPQVSTAPRAADTFQAPNPVRDQSNVQLRKPWNADTLIRGRHGNYGIWVDDSNWRVSEIDSNPAAELEFIHIDGDAYAIVIAERVEMPLDAVRDFFLQSVKRLAPDARFVLQERRIVNGNEVLCVQVAGTYQAIPFTYFGYLYSGRAGTIQLITYTAQNLFRMFEPDLTEFMNGFVVLKEGRAAID